MTCIVGYVDKKTKKVIIGGDSAGVSGYDIIIRKDTKVFKVEDFVIGCTSSFRMIQLLRFSFKPPEIKTKDIYEYMCTDFITSVRKCFADGGYLQKNTTGDEKGGTFLVAYKDRLFEIQDDFQVGENLNGISAAGCGEKYALAALHTLSNIKMTSKQKVLKTLETASFYSNGVSAPFVIMST
jgi:ATP-dependent protease HslVU (ClpYQ) peptidase subunit